MPDLFDAFPDLRNERIHIRQMCESDVDALMAITENPNVYRYISPFLFQKSRNVLLTAIRNLNGRDFEKKKLIIAGIYLPEEPEKLIGLAEMFDYMKRANTLTIGYRLNEGYWNKGVATNTVALMTDYLLNTIGIQTLQAFVMPQNIASAKVLLKNGYILQEETVKGENWGGQETVELAVYKREKSIPGA